MTDPGGTWYDEAAGPLVRPYVLAGGRSRPARSDLDLISIVVAMTDRVDELVSPEHAAIVRVCQRPASVAEVSAAVDLPLLLVKIMLSDLIEQGVVTFRSPRDPSDIPNPELILAVLDGIRRL